jgi:fumarate hydratase class II
MITTMNELHPTAIELAKIEADYAKTLAKLATLKAARRDKKREHKAAIVDAINETPDATHVDLAARFAVTEGTIRHIRRELAPTES